MSNTIVILNGPGLPKIATPDILKACENAGVSPDYRQTDDFATLMFWVRNLVGKAMILNPTSDRSTNTELYHDSIEAMSVRDMPVVEVCLDKADGYNANTNEYSQNTTGIVGGMGNYGYILAINALANKNAGNGYA